MRNALLKRLAAWLSDLRLAIVLLLMIALASAVGTGIPQGDPPSSYIDAYADTPWLGLLIRCSLESTGLIGLRSRARPRPVRQR